MNKKKILAIAMAGAMMTGTLATAVPVFADDNTTTVSVTVAPKNTYTLTVPAATTLDSTGEATQLKNGIRITDGTLEEGKKLIVTASSAADWKMSATGKETTIEYALYSDAGTTAATTWEFSKDEANATDGTTKEVYAEADAEDLAAASGTYSDVITFTAEVADAVTGVTFTIDGASYTVDEGTTWAQFIEGAGKDVVAVYCTYYVMRINPYSMLKYNGNPVGVGEKIQNGGVYTKAY